ncbi:MAG: hypothetical protein GC155_16040 [Alphaproteobacteria bacterium]|nr:hypothetical protein [Alphaproteobacteria bacterium]
MDRRRLLFIAAGLGVALMGVAALAFFTASHPRPDTLMSGLRVAGLSGYDVRDTSDRDVGHVIAVETDRHGRTRYIRAALNGGEKVRIAAFRARLDRSAETINLTVPVAAVVTDPGAVVESGPSVDVADAGGPAS